MLSVYVTYPYSRSSHRHLSTDYRVPGFQVIFVPSYRAFRRFGKLPRHETRDVLEKNEYTTLTVATRGFQRFIWRDRLEPGGGGPGFF